MSTREVTVWDWPIRLVHWALVICLGLLWWTGEQGELERHKTVGLVTLALIVFRMLWGLFGSATARFSAFVRGPGDIARYLGGKDDGLKVGHNPLGALSVLALLGILLAQLGFGLIAQDVDGIESGPLSYLVEYDTADWAREWHHLLFNGILLLVALHLVAIAYYRIVKRNDLIIPMVTGRKRVADEVVQPRIAPLWLAVAVALVAAGFAWWIGQGAPTFAG